MTSLAALWLPSEILFGKGQRHALPAVARRLGSRALICTDERLSASADFKQMIAGLEQAGLTVGVDDRGFRTCRATARRNAPRPRGPSPPIW